MSADHPLYVEVEGLDHSVIEVFLAKDLRYAEHGEKKRLCTLVGGDYTYLTNGSGVPTLRLEVLNGATDVEHDPSRSADLQVSLPHTLREDGQSKVVIGILTDVALYPAGVDPLTASDQDTQPGECTECKPPHRFAPYMPPERDETQVLIGKPVLVRMKYVPRKRRS